MRQRLFLDRLAFRKRVRETEAKFASMRLQVPSVSSGEKLGMISDGEGSGAEGSGAPSLNVEPYQEGMDGFMRHEI